MMKISLYNVLNKLKGWLILLIAILICVSCNHEEVGSYESNTSYIYFDIPYQLDIYGNETSTRSDSISYSFALDDLSITNTTINVVAKVIGLPVDYDRPYEVELIDEKTTAISDVWNPTVIENRSIKAGELTDTIKIVVQRESSLQERWMQIGLRLRTNEYFQMGYANLETVKVSFSDILEQPSWWNAWANYFGPYYREVYLKWIELYYEGADTTTSFDNGEPLYWNNMPSYAVLSWYPILTMYLNQLKEYFEVNDIYPDGDTSLPAIKLP